MAAVNEKGYGRFQLAGRGTPKVKAHRYAYECRVGPIPDGMVIMHSCDNPACCNTRHLSLGVSKSTMSYSLRGGRQRPSERHRLDLVT